MSADGPLRPRKGADRAYHHGDLRRSLIAEAVRLMEESGVGAVSVREAARRAGVSAGAPFRHFPNRLALLAAVAEEAIAFLSEEVERSLATCGDAPIERFRAIGKAYLRWALRHPTHFELVSTSALFDLDGAKGLSDANDALVGRSRAALVEAAARGDLRETDVKLLLVAGRAMVYGFARMRLDGHFPRWGLDEAEGEAVADALVDLFVRSIERRP